jgi:hypothetical protein
MDSGIRAFGTGWAITPVAKPSAKHLIFSLPSGEYFAPITTSEVWTSKLCHYTWNVKLKMAPARARFPRRIFLILPDCCARAAGAERGWFKYCIQYAEFLLTIPPQ